MRRRESAEADHLCVRVCVLYSITAIERNKEVNERVCAYVYLNIPFDVKQLCANVRVHMWKVIMGLISGLACMRGCVYVCLGRSSRVSVSNCSVLLR